MRRNTEMTAYYPYVAVGHAYNQYKPSGVVLRADLTEKYITTLQTRKGSFVVTEIETHGLEESSTATLAELYDTLNRTREARREEVAESLGERVMRDAIIVSPLTLLELPDETKARFSEASIDFAQPADIQRDENSGNVIGARLLHIPQPTDTQYELDLEEVADARQQHFDESRVWDIVSQSQDRQLHLKNSEPLPTDTPTEPQYDWKNAGYLLDGTGVDYATLGGVLRPPLPGRLTVEHSRSAIALAQHGQIDPATYAQVLVARGMERDPNTHQQTQEFNRLCYFGTATVRRFIERNRRSPKETTS